MTKKNLDPIKIGNSSQLFVDEYLIDSKKNLDLKLHSLITRETALELDEPWE